MVNFTDHYGTAKEQKVNVTVDGNFVIVCVEGMAIADFSTLVTCTLYGADGTVLSAVTDSVESYTCRMAAELQKNGVDLGDAIAKFGTSAYAYFRSREE